ncbi:MAG: hypothetical protein QOF43_891 [Gaiellaceae bacterium]|jgi:hypothetical protein|nr:hypothetical protein [Gaiellaceae bacterium]
MSDAWFTEFAAELARCLVDAESCAQACEQLLERAQASGDAELQRHVVDAVVGVAAIARVLIELIDHPPQLTVAAARLCREAAIAAIARLEALGDRIDTGEAIAALRASEASCARLLDVSAPL